MDIAQPTILAVDDEAPIREILSEYLTGLGYRVLTADSGESALEVFRQDGPDLVLTDVLMGEMDGVELLKKIKDENPKIPVVIFTAFSSEDLVIQALRLGAVDFIKKPFSFSRLKTTVECALCSISERHENDFEIESLVREEKYLVVPSDPQRIPGLINQLMASSAKYLDYSRRREVAVALHEMILNAIEHGNLEISYREKTESLKNGNYLDLLRQRRKVDPYAQRKVYIQYLLDYRGLSFNIKDQGSGFDWRNYLETGTDHPANLEAHGRGLVLVSHYVDQIEFNERGNEVKLVIRSKQGGSPHV